MKTNKIINKLKAKGIISRAILLYIKHKEVTLYLVFGVLTTIVNWVVTVIFFEILEVGAALTTTVAWAVSVLFAYVTNKIFVFESKDAKGRTFLIEMLVFFSARVISGAADVLIMTVFVDVLGWHKYGVKLFSQIFVIVFNYIASKLFIFKKKKT